MSIGIIYKHVGNNSSLLKRWLKSLYLTIYGTPDLHSHIRWRAVKDSIDSNAQTVLDIGCGDGMFLFELVSNKHTIHAVGIDINKKSIEIANYIKNKLSIYNINFYCLDVTKSLLPENKHFDQVLLIDVLEHIVDDGKLIVAVSGVLKPGGNVIISVPTPNYPQLFGTDFHREVGHVREGYWIEDLTEMLDKYGFSIIENRYYTYLPSAILCGIFYKHIRKTRLSILASPILNILSFADAIWPLRNGKYACSALIKAKKRI